MAEGKIFTVSVTVGQETTTANLIYSKAKTYNLPIYAILSPQARSRATSSSRPPIRAPLKRQSGGALGMQSAFCPERFPSVR